MKNLTTRFTEFATLPKVMLCFALLWGITSAAFGQDNVQQFSMGFSRSLFSNVNDNDAKAFIKAWAQTVARERNIDADPSAQLFDRADDMTAAMNNGSVDALGITFEEFTILSSEVETDHWFLIQVSDELYEEYILLVQDIADTDGLDALRGRKLLFHDSARTSLAMYWLESMMKQQNLPGEVAEYFSTIKHVKKISGVVLPVFFGQVDACLVTQSGFNTIVELNPQIGRKLRTVAKSRPLIPALLCFRKDFNSPQKGPILEAFRELHASSAGQQILTIFQAEALLEVDAKALEKTRSFVAKLLDIPMEPTQ